MGLAALAVGGLAAVLALVWLAQSDWGPTWHENDLGYYARVNHDKLYVRPIGQTWAEDYDGPWAASIEYEDSHVVKGGGVWDTAGEAKKAIYAKYKRLLKQHLNDLKQMGRV